jgi:membrane-associated protein
VLAGGILVCVVYSLALIPAIPRLVGSHPVLLELLSGSLPGMVSAGAHARIGATPLAVAVAAGVPGTIMFDWLFWWAGRRWGHRGALLFVGQGPRQARWVVRAERLGARWGGVAIVIGYYLPIPNVLIYALVGLSGMGLGAFLVWDVLGAAVWSGVVVGLGYAIGRRAVDVAHAISHYSLLATLVLVGLVFARQAFVRR